MEPLSINTPKQLSLPVLSDAGVISFLSSGQVKGIGKVFATRLVEKFGRNILYPEEIREEDFLEVKGMTLSRLEDLKESLKKLKTPPETVAFLFSCGLSESDVKKIIGHYGKHTERVVYEDPYNMVEDVWKLSFFTADKIGRTLGVVADDVRRLRGALLTAIKIYAENGSMYATEEEALNTASRISGVPIEKFKDVIDSLIRDERIVRSRNGLYLPVYYTAEKEGARKIGEIVRNFKKDDVIFELPQTDRDGNRLTSDQLEAIKTVIENPVTIITGGPGTGKTTTVRGIISLMEQMDRNVVLAAPTGRAAKRLTDLAGKEASTIHRLLGYRQGKGYLRYQFETDILIIDEASMLEQVMFNHLLQALKPETRIVLVGDVDQLPPIGAGDVLRDMIKSGTVPVITLDENFRQKEGSAIAANAKDIKRGEMPHGNEETDFVIINTESQGKIHDRIIELVTKEIPEKYGIDPKEIQVVSPQQEGLLGAKQLNIDLQKIINPEAPELVRGLKRFRLGDRVMQTSNSSLRHIFNGETGWVSDIDTDKGTLEITFFDGKKSLYNKKELGELTLAYATSVHKLQGSETDYMVMPVSKSHRNMLYRSLLYTGVSRARKKCFLVGEDEALKTAVENNINNVRNTNFKDRLRKYLPMIIEKSQDNKND